MSHHDSDLDHHDYLRGPYTKPNAKCPQCGREFHMNRAEDTGDLCDGCVRASVRKIKRAAIALQRQREREEKP